MYKVKNVSNTYQNYKYTVIRKVINDDTNEIEYWYYCGYNNIVLAQEVVKELNNGVLITPDLIEVDFYDNW